MNINSGVRLIDFSFRPKVLVFSTAHARMFIKIIRAEFKIKKRPILADKFRSLDSRISKFGLDSGPLIRKLSLEWVVRFWFERKSAEITANFFGTDQVEDLWISQEIWHFSTFSVLGGTLFSWNPIPQRARHQPGPLEFFEGG